MYDYELFIVKKYKRKINLKKKFEKKNDTALFGHVRL